MPWFAECKLTFIDISNNTVFDNGQVYEVTKYEDNKVKIKQHPSNDLSWYTMSQEQARHHFYTPVWFSQPSKQQSNKIQGHNIDSIIMDELETDTIISNSIKKILQEGYYPDVQPIITDQQLWNLYES